MSRDELKKQLQGTRLEVKAAAKTIYAQFEQIRNGGPTSVALQTLKYEINILRLLCFALQENCHKHADIYCEIAASLLPHAAPQQTHPDYWTNHLMSLQYIHHALCKEHTIKECQRFYALITTQPCQILNKSQYKHYLGIHVKHLDTFGHLVAKKPTPELRSQLSQALRALGALLQEMLRLQQKTLDKEGYGDLMVEVNQLLGKRSLGFIRILGNLPVAEINSMCEPLFKLIASNGDGSNTEQLNGQFPECLSALLALLQLDDCAWQQDKQAQPWTLQLLRSCNKLYKQQTIQNYALQLLYYYMKLLNQRECLPAAELKRAYIDVTKKLVNYFEQKAQPHAQEQWYIDFLLLFVRLQKQLHQVDQKLASLESFWQGLGGTDSAQAYTAHFELIQCLTSMTMKLTSSSALAPTCTGNDSSCQSLRKHCIFTLGYCATVAYSSWQPAEQGTLSSASQACLASIIHYAIDIAKVTKCLTPSNSELMSFAWHLINIMEKVSSSAQMRLLELLLKQLQQLRPLLTAPYERQLIRRLYKASAYCSTPHLGALLHCAYITSMTCPARQFQQLCVFYHNPKTETNQCLLELHGQSPLCNPLEPKEKRQLFELDMLAVLSSKKPPQLLHSLLRHCQTDYQRVLLGRKLRNDKSVSQQFEELRVKLQRVGRKQKLTRLQNLVLGHATVTKLLEALEAQKTKIPIKETTEKGLEELLIKYKLLNLSISNEMPQVELATTAMDAFESFFDQADAEPLSSDEAVIDWEALIDDGIVAAMALSTMGYMPQADKAWLLLMRISRLLGDSFNYLRAMSHFLQRDTKHALFDLPEAVSHAEQLIDELWPQLHAPHLLKRHHTSLLLCLCHLALYYARLDCICHAQLLLLHAEQLRLEFEERVGKWDIVQLTIQMVRFRMCYQQKHCRLLSRLPTALQQLDTLTEGVRNFAPISSMDNGALILLMADIVRDTTECTANRLSERPNFSNSLLQVLLNSGLVLRIVEVLISWLWTNLRMECLEKAHSKLRLIEHFLCIQSLQDSRLTLEQEKQQLPEAPMDAQTKHMSELVAKMFDMQLEQGVGSVEPIRKQQQINLSSPQRELHPSSNHLKLRRYVQLDLQHSHPKLRSSMQLQCIYFVVGCLYARLFFLQRQYDELDDFYAQANAWLKQNDGQGYDLGHMVLVLQMYQANYLRAKQKQQKAIDLAESALLLVDSEQLKHRVDINYRYNLLLQLRAARLELHPLPQHPRRALTFNISPETPPGKPVSKIAQKSKSARKPAKFEIYTEDEVHPFSSSGGSSSERGSSPEEQSGKLDLNACQLIEIIDLSDDEPEQAAPVKPSKSVRSTRTRAKQEDATPVRRTATAPTVKRTATRRNATSEEQPSTRGRTRRQLQQQQPALEQPSDSATSSSSSSRRRQMNL